MSRGYVIVCDDMKSVLCLASDSKSLSMVEVTNVSILNKAVCAPDMTEAKNLLNHIKKSEDHKHIVDGAEIENIARLYNKFF